MTTIGARLRYLREKKLHLSREKFIHGLGVSTKTLERYENDESSPPAEFINKLWHKYHKQLTIDDINWLLTGEKTEYLPARKIPVIGQVPAGFPYDFVNEDVREYLYLPDTPEGAYALIVDGDSMAPDIKDGDYVIFLPADKSLVLPGDVVVASNEFGQPMVKRYVVKKDGSALLKSDNPEYPSFEPNEEYKIIGKVIDVWRRKRIRRKGGTP